MTRGVLGLAAMCVVAACAHNVPQDKATSTDGRIKGAKPIALDHGEASDSGIVTYPGGDRVDWKVVELPDKQRGTLDVTLTWTTPRPGLKLGFDVFDAWNNPVGAAKRDTESKSKNRLASIKNAKGKYFIRVYAVGRGDAGRYKLALSFKETSTKPPIDWLAIPIDNPPKLADLPGVVVPCDEFQPDLANPECKKKCWPGAPANWPGCANKCNVTPPDPAIPACAATMDCPRGGDIRVKRCTKRDFPPCPDPKKPDLNNLNCIGITVAPVIGRIVGTQIQGSEVVLKIAVGTHSGVTKDWRGEVLQGGTKTAQPAVVKPMSGGTITVTGVDADVTYARTTLTPDQLAANPWVRLSAPNPSP